MTKFVGNLLGVTLGIVFLFGFAFVLVPSVSQTSACVALNWMDPATPPKMKEYREKFIEEHSTWRCITRFHSSYYGVDIWKILRISPGIAGT